VAAQVVAASAVPRGVCAVDETGVGVSVPVRWGVAWGVGAGEPGERHAQPGHPAAEESEPGAGRAAAGVPVLNVTHSASGAAAGVWLAVAVDPSPPVAVAGAVLGAWSATWPDFDHLDAKPVRALELTRVRFKGVHVRRPAVKLLGFTLVRGHSWTLLKPWVWRIGPGPLLSWCLRALSQATTGRKHRGLTHGFFSAFLSASVVLLLTLQVLAVGTAVYLAAAVWLGFVAALAGDEITKDSLRHAFWPFDVELRVPRCLRITVGGFAEMVILTVLVVLVIPGGVWLMVAAHG
jgi:hypothetical protein